LSNIVPTKASDATMTTATRECRLRHYLSVQGREKCRE
jgi:hypothetical protein